MMMLNKFQAFADRYAARLAGHLLTKAVHRAIQGYARGGKAYAKVTVRLPRPLLRASLDRQSLFRNLANSVFAKAASLYPLWLISTGFTDVHGLTASGARDAKFWLSVQWRLHHATS